MQETRHSIVDYGEPVDMTKNIIKVIGVGGGGCNAVRNMFEEGISDVSFAVCNTDSMSGFPRNGRRSLFVPMRLDEPAARMMAVMP